MEEEEDRDGDDDSREGPSRASLPCSPFFLDLEAPVVEKDLDLHRLPAGVLLLLLLLRTLMSWLCRWERSWELLMSRPARGTEANNREE